MNSNKKKIFNINYAIFLFTTTSILFLYVAYKDFQKVSEAKEIWKNRPQAEGVLELVESRRSGSSNFLEVKYQYYVDGQAYEGNTLGSVNGPLLTNATTIMSIKNAYSLYKGNPVKVYYNPEKPSESRLFADTGKDMTSGITSSIVSGVLFLIAIAVFIYRLKVKKRSKESAEEQTSPALK